jgi:hypothetical protein
LILVGYVKDVYDKDGDAGHGKRNDDGAREGWARDAALEQERNDEVQDELAALDKQFAKPTVRNGFRIVEDGCDDEIRRVDARGECNDPF